MKKLVKRIFPRHLSKEIRAFLGCYRLKRLVKSAHSLRIVVGASGVFDDDWIPAEIEYFNLLRRSHWERFFQKNSIDAILAEHVWEHLTLEEGLIAARHCYEYLKTDGYLRVAVPDGYHPGSEYIEWVKADGIGPGADDHKVLYNHETFADLFSRVGFNVRLLEYFSSTGHFHFVEWDPDKGKIHRSKRYDQRNKDGSPRYTSIILDAFKTSSGCAYCFKNKP